MVALVLDSQLPGNPANTGMWFAGFPMPANDSPVALSRLAWRLADCEYAGWIEPGSFPEFSWRLSKAGLDEALRRQRMAPAMGQPPCTLSQRRDEVLKEAMRWCFGDHAWCVLLDRLIRTGLRISGVIGHGPRVEIDDLLLCRLAIDLRHDEAVTVDGETKWRALAVGWPSGHIPVLRTEAFAELPELPAREPATLQGAFVKWYADAYPEGHPVGKKHDDLAFEAARSLGRKVSARTVRRSLRDFRPRPSAAR
jgi:hypothetical protein